MQETTITPTKISEFKFSNGTKTGWNIEAKDGKKYACFSSTEITRLAEGVDARIKYEVAERNGYENRNIKSVADPESGQFVEKPATGGGGRPSAKADPDKLRQDKELEIARNKSIQRQVAAKEATQIVTLSGCTVSDAKFWNVWDTAYDHVLTKLLEIK